MNITAESLTNLKWVRKIKFFTKVHGRFKFVAVGKVPIFNVKNHTIKIKTISPIFLTNKDETFARLAGQFPDRVLVKDLGKFVYTYWPLPLQLYVYWDNLSSMPYVKDKK